MLAVELISQKMLISILIVFNNEPIFFRLIATWKTWQQ